MIQRIQSVFLFFVAVSMVLMLFFPLWQKVDPSSSENVVMDSFYLTYEKSEGIVTTENTFYIAIVAVLIALVALISIFQFKNRLRQIKLGALISFLILGIMILSVYFVMQGEKLILPEQRGQYLWAFYLPLVALVFNFLSNRFIRKDEMLVRSADRIR